MSRWLTEEAIAAHQAKMRNLRNGGTPAEVATPGIDSPSCRGSEDSPACESKAVARPVTRKAYPVAELCMSAGLLMPVKEYRFALEIDRQWRFDFAWPAVKLYLEIDGGIWIDGGHNRGAFMLHTFEKRNAASRMGWRGLWYAPETLGAAVDDLKLLLPTVD